MSDDISHLAIDNFNLRLIVSYQEKLDEPGLSDEDREMYKYLIRGCKEALTMDYESVQDPFCKGHFTVVKFKRGTQRPLTWEEERFNALSPEEQEKVRKRNK